MLNKPLLFKDLEWWAVSHLMVCTKADKEQRSKTHLKTLHATSKHKECYGVAIKNILSFTFLGVKLKSYWLTQRHQMLTFQLNDFARKKWEWHSHVVTFSQA